MKRGREEDRLMGPLFPRLHVNDADKGGPRAPPRNKMALYEQLSIPSQRFNSSTAPSLAIPPHHAGSLVPSASSSQGCGHERSVFTPIYAPSRIHPNATEKDRNRSTEEINPNAMRMGLDKKSQRHVSQRMVNTASNEKAGAECSSPQPHGLSSAKHSSGKKQEDDDDFCVPTFIQPGVVPQSGKDLHLMDREIVTHFHSDSLKKNGTTSLKSPIRLQNSDGMPLEQQRTRILMSRQHERGSGEGKDKETTMHIKSTENMARHLAVREKPAEPSNLSKRSSNQECQCGKSNKIDTSHCGTASLRQESSGTFGGPRHLSDAEVMEKQGMLNRRSGSYSKTSLANGFGGFCVAENGNAAGEDEVTGTGEDAEKNGSSGDADKTSLSGGATKHDSQGDADRNDDASETSMVDSISGVGMSPDDVVGVIGPKHFWKARRAIINQQRVFAAQVFELHRLIRVQKLIAASPCLLIEDTSYVHGSTPKSSMKDPPDNSFIKPEQYIGKEKDESCKVNSNTECHKGNMVSVPSLHEDSNRPVGQLQRNGPCSGNLPSIPAPSDNKPGSWSFHPPSNHWLVPVMSPTEGLIYKPYAGACPPTGAFMAPVYGACSAPSMPPGAGDFIGQAYGVVPTSHRQQDMGVLPCAPAVAPNFMPAPFGFPVVNSLVSSSAVEQVSSLAGPLPSGNKKQQSRSSCNISNPEMSEALSECVRKVQTTKGRDLQGSAASSPVNRAQQDALSLFPMASAMECPRQPSLAHCRDHQSRVIKVVPHNPRSATESAARIFQSIQNERQQHDSM